MPGGPTTCGKRGRDSAARGSAGDEPLVVERGCKAGNLKCGLEMGKRNPLKAMNCDLCCVEFGFCSECSCILCGKTTDQTVGQYSFIRCEGKLIEEFVCGHVAHLDCALLCHMAGVVRGHGLDVEYYCRRCDKKTDLMMHVVGLLQATESVKIRDDVEKNLSLALRILQGTQRIEARNLQIVIDSALKKLRNRMNLDDIGELRDISMMVDAGRVGDTNGVHYQPQPLNISPLLVVSSRGETMQQPVHITGATDPKNTENESPFGSSSGARNQDPITVQPAASMPDVMLKKGNVSAHDRLQRRSRIFLEDTHGTSDLLDSPVRITNLKFENKIHQALEDLKRSPRGW